MNLAIVRVGFLSFLFTTITLFATFTSLKALTLALHPSPSFVAVLAFALHQLQKSPHTSSLSIMTATFYDLNSESGQKKLDEYLLTRSYISGLPASKDDITVHATFSKAPPSQYVNVSRWYNHINALLSISGVSGEGCGVIVKGFDFAPITEADATPPTDDAKASAVEKKKKFCLIIMKKLEEASRSFQMDDGLIMKKLVPNGHGIKKVRIRLAIRFIEDKLKAEPINVCVQVKSCDIVPSSTKSNLRPHSTPRKWNLRILE